MTRVGNFDVEDNGVHHPKPNAAGNFLDWATQAQPESSSGMSNMIWLCKKGKKKEENPIPTCVFGILVVHYCLHKLTLPTSARISWHPPEPIRGFQSVWPWEPPRARTVTLRLNDVFWSLDSEHRPEQLLIVRKGTLNLRLARKRKTQDSSWSGWICSHSIVGLSQGFAMHLVISVVRHGPHATRFGSQNGLGTCPNGDGFVGKGHACSL